MKKLKINLTDKVPTSVVLLLGTLVSLAMLSCSKSGVEDEKEEGDTEIRYIIALDNAAAKNAGLTISYMTGSGQVTTDAPGFGLSTTSESAGKNVKVTKPFHAGMSVSVQNSSTVQADLRLQINVDNTVKKSIALKVPANSTNIGSVEYTIAE
ncbi:MAG: hypothetical protein QM594_12735 [Niabella sp.]